MDKDLLDRAHALAEESFLAGSGPGGQNANKVATEVQLRVNIYALRLPPPVFARLRDLAGSKLTTAGDLMLTARDHRTQEANRTSAAKEARKVSGQPGRQGQAAAIEESARPDQSHPRKAKPLRLVTLLDFSP